MAMGLKKDGEKETELYHSDEQTTKQNPHETPAASVSKENGRGLKRRETQSLTVKELGEQFCFTN